MKAIKATVAFFVLISFSSMSALFNRDCLKEFSDEVNAAGAELESDLVHCSGVSYAAHLCYHEARVSYSRSVDTAVNNFETCK